MNPLSRLWLLPLVLTACSGSSGSGLVLPFGDVPPPPARAALGEDGPPSEAGRGAVDAAGAMDAGAGAESQPSSFAGHLPAPAQAEGLKLTPHVACDPGCAEPPWDAQHPAPVAMWSQELDEVPQRFERDLRVDVYGVVLYGNAVLYDRSYGTETELEAWHAFHAPGGGISVASRKPRPRMVFAVVNERLPMRLLRAQSPKPWALRPAELRIVDLGGTQDLAWAGGSVHARIGFETGRASLGLMLTSPKAPMPAHEHSESWEIMGLLTADGEIRRAAAGRGGSSRRLVDGDVMAVPRGVRHYWVPSGERPLLGVQLYVPPGPEQRFKDLAQVP